MLGSGLTADLQSWLWTLWAQSHLPSQARLLWLPSEELDKLISGALTVAHLMGWTEGAAECGGGSHFALICEPRGKESGRPEPGLLGLVSAVTGGAWSCLRSPAWQSLPGELQGACRLWFLSQSWPRPSSTPARALALSTSLSEPLGWALPEDRLLDVWICPPSRSASCLPTRISDQNLCAGRLLNLDFWEGPLLGDRCGIAQLFPGLWKFKPIWARAGFALVVVSEKRVSC